MQLVAVTSNLISEVYHLYDVLFKDLGTSNDYSEWTSDSNMSVSRDTETTFYPESSSSYSSRYLNLSNYNNRPLTIEMDLCMIYSTNPGSSFMSLRNGTTAKVQITPSYLGLVSGEYVHLKLIVTEDTCNVTVDDETKTPKSHDGTFNRLYFGINAGVDWTFKYKNFIIY